MRPPREDTKPWYRQFWPWFLIAIPGLTVVAAMITINLAVSGSDSLVRDDYYKEGLAINLDLARERMASDLGIRIDLAYDAAAGRITAQMNDAPVGNLDSLHMQMVHPTMDDLDAQVPLQRTGERVYNGTIAEPFGDISWHLMIAAPGDETWKISSRWNPVRSPSLVLEPAASDGKAANR